MYGGDLAYLFLRFIFCIICVCICIYFILIKKRIVCWENAVDSKKMWMKEHEKRINRIIACCMGIACIVFIEAVIIPYIRDIPYIIRGEYKIVTGIACNKDHGGRNLEEERTVQILSEDGCKVEVIFFDDYIDEGEKLTVIYLPNSKFGSRIDKN